MSSPLPLLDNSDPRLKLMVQNRVRNVFVTQPEDTRHPKEENVKFIPVVTEPPGRLLETGVNTLQKTLILKKQAELEEVDRELGRKRQDFKSRMELVARRKLELKGEQQQNKERRMKFEKFVAENEAKRLQAMKKYEVAQEQNKLKQREIEYLKEQLKQRKSRQTFLKGRMTKYKIYEDYLLKTLEYFPKTSLDNGSDSAAMSVIRRHETLSDTKRELQQRLGRLEAEVEQSESLLQSLKQEHSIKILMGIKQLSELQSQLQKLKEENKNAEVKFLMEQGLSREKAEEMGTLLMAVNNLAEQCYIPTYGPLENMNMLTKMDMEYVLDKMETEKRARMQLESGSALTSRTALTDRREKGSMKGSTTQLKSPSKVSRKSQMMS
ncbi:uncharacterized protein CCDC197 isoform X2 [Nelusetta ayraudi]|uniref:uncharacterized protein CCDC197 isoform X2 n=1 Tax=Nelusetta ayraudi TaxID=303726 RepID=UPI003F711D06